MFHLSNYSSLNIILGKPPRTTDRSTIDDGSSLTTIVVKTRSHCFPDTFFTTVQPPLHRPESPEPMNP